jgi:hypothetical protein
MRPMMTVALPVKWTLTTDIPQSETPTAAWVGAAGPRPQISM